jgi:hypothetical protein
LHSASGLRAGANDETENGNWIVRFCDLDLGVIERKTCKFPAPPRTANGNMMRECRSLVGK